MLAAGSIAIALLIGYVLYNSSSNTPQQTSVSNTSTKAKNEATRAKSDLTAKASDKKDLPTQSPLIKVNPSQPNNKTDNSKAIALQEENRKKEQAEIARLQFLAEQEQKIKADARALHCRKVKLHYENSQKRITQVDQAYAQRTEQLREQERSAFLNNARSTTWSGALNAGARASAPIKEAMNVNEIKRRDEVSKLQTELEQYRIENLDCF